MSTDGQLMILWNNSLGLWGGHHGCLDKLRQFHEFLGGIGQKCPSPGDNQRFLSLGQKLDRCLDIGEFGRGAGVLLGGNDIHVACCSQCVGRDFQLHGTGAARFELTHGLVDGFRNLLGSGDPRVPFCDRLEDVQLILHFVQLTLTLTQSITPDLAGDQQNR